MSICIKLAEKHRNRRGEGGGEGRGGDERGGGRGGGGEGRGGEAYIPLLQSDGASCIVLHRYGKTPPLPEQKSSQA